MAGEKKIIAAFTNSERRPKTISGIETGAERVPVESREWITWAERSRAMARAVMAPRFTAAVFIFTKSGGPVRDRALGFSISLPCRDGGRGIDRDRFGPSEGSE